MYYIFKILAGSHYISRPGTKVLRKVKRGQTFKSNNDLEKSFGRTKFQKLGTCDGSCEEGELFKVVDISLPNPTKLKKESIPTPVVEVEVQEDETVTDDNTVTDSDGSDDIDDPIDEDDNEVDEDDSDDSEETEEEDEEEEVEFTLPMQLKQISDRKFDVIDDNGTIVNDKRLSRKLANALIKSYKKD